MTIRNFFSAALFSNGFLLLAASVQATPSDQQPAESLVASRTTAVLQHNVSLLQVDDSNTLDASLLDSAALANAAKMPEVRMNPAVVKYVQDYIKKNNEGLQKVEARSEPVFKIMEPILAKYNLPVELKYLAVVESDLKRTAVSRVGAVGAWQLMPATARELGLKVNKKADERKHYYKSTTAAAKYLRDLYTVYEDWLLVIAAYNAGPGNINKAIKKAGSRNFWKLQHFLPAETRGHVKRFIGTHYFFENAGSATTLTKAENMAHAKKLEQFAALQQSEVEMVKRVVAANLESMFENEVFK